MASSDFDLTSVPDSYTLAAYGCTGFRRHGSGSDVMSSPDLALAIFDIDGTLIKPKGKTVFPKSIDDWRWISEAIKPTLHKLYDDGFELVLITNQKKLSADDIKAKAAQFYADLQVPFVLVSGHSNEYYRKPHTGLWKVVVSQLSHGPVDMRKSFFVGDMVSDNAFAHNVGLKFKTAASYWSIPNNTDALTYCHPLENLISIGEKDYGSQDPKHLIVTVGPAASGKSHIAKRLALTHNYTIINQDTLKTPAKQKAAFKAAVAAGTSIIVDNTNPMPSTRALWIEPAKAAGYRTTILFIDIPKPASMFLNDYRYEVSGGTASYVPSVAYNIYYSKLVKPTAAEADEIITETQLWVKNATVRKQVLGLHL
jgi:bifunctional polynucleotide phosphatase/kinase